MFSTGQEQTVSLPDGRAFTLGRLTVGVIRQFKEWCAAQVGDPFDLVDRFLGRAPDADVSRLLRDAEETRDSLRYFSLACPVARRAIATEQGLAKLMGLLLA